MTIRQTYRNGDPIQLHNCDGCTPLRINGTLVHEAGCPESWRDYQRSCKECGTEFWPEDRYDEFCSDHCYAMYSGLPCDCDDCNQDDLENIRFASDFAAE